MFALKNSTTILLPTWNKTLPLHGLPVCMMPRDVSTRWNSTFDMLEFAIRYRVAIDAMTAVREFDLRKYELVSAEWDIAMELRDVLKVSNPSLPFVLLVHTILSRFSKTQHYFFLVTSPTWPLSSPPWMSSTRSLLLRPGHRPSSPLQSALRSPLGKGLWTNTTTKQGSQTSIALRWVSLFLNSTYVIPF